MDWLFKLLPFIKNSNADEFKAIMAELKGLKDEYKEQVKDQQIRIEGLEKKVLHLEIMEMQCLENHRILINEYRDLKEKFIFKTGGRHNDDEIIN